MEADLILGEEGGDEIQDTDFVFYTEMDYISAAFYAIEAAASANPMTEIETRRVKRINKKAIAIIDHCIGKLHQSIFDDEDNN